LTEIGESAGLRCTRLLGASQWAPGQSAVGALLARRREWRLRAGHSGVRTALLYASGWLVQWHEGSETAVAAEWERLRADPMLRNARLLHSSTGRCVLREPVQLSSLHAPETPADVARRLHALAREQEQGWTAEPAQIWQALGAPCRLGRVGVLGRVGPRELLAVAGEDNEAVDLVRLLAQDHGVQVAYQRYADGNLERRDMGAAYADVRREGNRITRVQALPWRALEGGALLMLGVPPIDRLLVMLGADGRRGRAMLAEVAQLLHTLPRAPEVQLVCRCPGALRHARDALDRVPGLRYSIVAAPGTARFGADLASGMLDAGAGASASAGETMLESGMEMAC
jgi:hypothetical protein